MGKQHDDDPRDASLETACTLPKTWKRESSDALNASGLMLSGLIMITRNRYLAWPAVLFSINTIINAHPLRSKDGGQNTGIMLAFGALIASYMPFFIVPNIPPQQSTPLPTFDDN